MRVALGVTAFATVYIGIFPEQFIRMVNWSLGIAQTTISRQLSVALRLSRLSDGSDSGL